MFLQPKPPVLGGGIGLQKWKLLESKCEEKVVIIQTSLMGEVLLVM